MLHIRIIIFVRLIVVMIRISFNWIGCVYAKNVILLDSMIGRNETLASPEWQKTIMNFIKI